MRARTLQMLCVASVVYVMTIFIKKPLGDNLMKKALLPLVIASFLPAAAFADVTVYILQQPNRDLTTCCGQLTCEGDFVRRG